VADCSVPANAPRDDTAVGRSKTREARLSRVMALIGLAFAPHVASRFRQGDKVAAPDLLARNVQGLLSAIKGIAGEHHRVGVVASSEGHKSEVGRLGSC